MISECTSPSTAVHSYLPVRSYLLSWTLRRYLRYLPTQPFRISSPLQTSILLRLIHHCPFSHKPCALNPLQQVKNKLTMPHLLSDLNFPTLRKDIYHIWHSHHNPRLQRYSQASNSNPPRDLDSHGFTSQGTVVPGILHVGRLLGVAAFQGLPAPRPAHYSEDVGYMQLTTAADIIVSVLYMRHPGLLRRFLDVLPDQEFTYMHSMEERAESIEWFGRLEERPFVIVRNGNMVEVSDSYDTGEASSAWEPRQNSRRLAVFAC